jgi:soluble lytic murein transglycosylase
VLLRFLPSLALLAALLASPAHASVESSYKAAREAFQKGRMDLFQRHAAKIPADHDLAPYIEYWRLKANSPGVEAQRAFIARHADSHLSQMVRADLARRFGGEGRWPEFREEYRQLPRPDQELQCHALRASLQDNEPTAEKAAIALWRVAKDLPSACDAVFTLLVERGILDTEERFIRLRLALETGNQRLARELIARLPQEAGMDGDALTRGHAGDEKLLATADERRGQREAALYALSRIARDDPARAAALWEQHHGQFPAQEQLYGWGQIAMHAARRHDARALEWFKRAGGTHGEAQLLWKARASLRAGRWLDLHNTILAMPEPMQSEPVWRYWKARALKALNANFPANVLFAGLSREFHYYGLLAEEELPVKVETRPIEYKVTPDDLKAAEARPALRRALLLRKLDDMGNAMAEWSFALGGLDDRQLLAAAELARREGWYDRAIFTAERTREVHDFDLRYLAPYRDLASAQVNQNGLDEAWIYGLMRQESRFVQHARSVAGAQGLMQIMPATARWIGRQLGLKANAYKEMNRPENNIRFGTYYLKRIYDDLDQSTVLATAGYNAGPGRARRWQADVPLEGAVYVESIPFAETRDYVKKVLANAMYYRSRFGGDSVTLKERLGVIPARRAAVPENQDEKAPFIE